MIAKIHYDTSFDRLSAYVTQQAGKLAEVLAVNGVRVSSAGEMAADFEFQSSTRPGVTVKAEHISLAWPPGETEKLTNEVMTRAAMRYMKKRGIDPEQTQWVLARHYDEDHPHCHLLLNRVTNDGGLVPDKCSKLRSAEACRKVEAEMGFVDAAKLGAAKTLTKAEQAEPPVKEVVDRLRLKALVAQALVKHLPVVTTIGGLQEALTTEGISLTMSLQKGKLQGVVFTAEAYPGLHMKGSEVARQYSGGQLRKTLEAQAEYQAQTDSPVKLPQQPVIPVVPEPAGTVHSTSVPSAMLPENSLPVAPRSVVAALTGDWIKIAAAPVGADKELPPVLVANQAPAVPQPGQNVLPPVVAITAVSPLIELTDLPSDSQKIPAPPADGSSLGRVETAPVVEAKVPWQYGIIQMQTTERGTSEERLNRVQAALVAAGATVGETVPPTTGRNYIALLPYSFDPTSTQLAEVNAVLRDVQAACDSKGVSTSRVKEQPHSWHQPHALPEADHLEWPAREGQFNQAQIVVDDPVRGQARAERVGEELRRAGASVSEATRDNQGLLTLQVHYHTCAPTISDIDTVLAQVADTSVAGMEVRESAQNKDARLDGVILVALRQEETSTGKEMGA